jgi:surface protein
MASMFLNCNSFTGNGVETWDTSNVRDMSMMFRFTPYFNGQISSWNVGQVTDMRGMFRQAIAFTGDLSQWDLRSVTDISQMVRLTFLFLFDCWILSMNYTYQYISFDIHSSCMLYGLMLIFRNGIHRL